MKIWLFILAASSLSLASCNYVTGKRIKGNGNMTTDDRSEGSFSGVESGGNFDIIVAIGPQSIKIEAEENVIPYIETYIDGDILRIKTKDGFWIKTSRSMKVYVTSPRLKKLEMNGGGSLTGASKITDSSKIDIEVHGNADIDLEVDAPEVESDLTGNGSVTLKGETRNFSSEATGNGHLKALDLKTENAKVKILGNGDAEVYSSVTLDVTIGGNGNISYKGDAKLTTHITGNGNVNKVN